MPHEKELELSLLLDFYGELLTDAKREAVELYYNDDLSLAEISEIVGISRQGVRSSIEKAKTELHFYEEKLGLAEKFREMSAALERVSSRLEAQIDLAEGASRAELCEINEILKTISI